MRDVMAVTKALADESRARIVLFLAAGEMCVCQIVEMLQLAPSTVSKHLDVLCRAGLIEPRKEGRWVYYRRPERPGDCAAKAIGWLEEALAQDPRALDDARRRKAVLKMDRETLCCRYKG
jgi:DNA-binding transcriptional ArsR family regulator